jgi:hypothetical protein
VDWRLFTRLSLAGLKFELVPESLYLYRMWSDGSIFYEMTSNAHQYHAHQGLAHELMRYVPPALHDFVAHAHFQLSKPGLSTYSKE